QFVKCDEYRPSRLSSAPMSLLDAASCRIRRLYSAVNLRRLAFSVTSYPLHGGV
ncbi:MAG: hypothetical protein RL033_2690, partial [Pseudomonadota bacterium]